MFTSYNEIFALINNDQHNKRSNIRLNYTVSQKNVPPLACYNFDTRERILIFLAEMLPIKYKQSKGDLL